MLGVMIHDAYSDEEEDRSKGDGKPRGKKEFDCPSCNANNPLEDVIVDGAELLCNYCGSEYRAKVSDEGRIKLKEM